MANQKLKPQKFQEQLINMQKLVSKILKDQILNLIKAKNYQKGLFLNLLLNIKLNLISINFKIRYYIDKIKIFNLIVAIMIHKKKQVNNSPIVN